MNAGAEVPAPPSLERVYEVATRGKLAEVDKTLGLFTSAQRLSVPRAIALRGVRAGLAADVPAGIALLRRALSHATPEGERRAFADMLIGFHISRNELDDIADLLDAIGHADDVLEPGFTAVRSFIAACRGHDGESERLARSALEVARALDDPLAQVRTIYRTALAAFYREDYGEAQERALETARGAERIEFHRLSSAAYSMLWGIAQAWSRDADVARFYADRIVIAARRDDNATAEVYGLVAQLGIAMESFDQKRFGSIRGRLLATAAPEQYRERFAVLLAEGVSAMWSGNFSGALSTLTSLRALQDNSTADSALADALLALTAVARLEFSTARRLSRAAISASSVHEPSEALYNRTRRRAARVVAAAACFALGDSMRGERALSAEFDPDGSIARAIISKDPVGGVETLLRGYMRAFSTARAAAASARPTASLTAAELRVLRALPHGETLADIAAGFGRSPKTVASQVESIYAKLQVSNRAQAIARARELGIVG